MRQDDGELGPFSVEHQIVEAGQPDLEARTAHKNLLLFSTCCCGQD